MGSVWFGRVAKFALSAAAPVAVAGADSDVLREPITFGAFPPSDVHDACEYNRIRLEDP